MNCNACRFRQTPLMKRKGRSLAELADCIEEYPQKVLSLAVRGKPPLEELPRLFKVMRDCEEALQDVGRIVVRYSGTEPKMRLLVEAREQALVDRWIEELTSTAREEIGV